MRIASLAVLGALAVTITAHADGRSEEIHGFAWPSGHDYIEGRVTDPAGHAMPKAQVHVVSAAGDAERVVTTDGNGRYRIKLPSTASYLVFVYGDARISTTAATSRVVNDQEAIEMDDGVMPIQLPRLRYEARLPPYSDAAINTNQWLRAWLLLDVDESGAVKRVKLVDAPGFDLDATAVRAAFDLDFEPARDPTNRPARTQLLWSIDWPAYSWLVDHGDGSIARMPDAASELPCKSAHTSQDLARSCAPPTIANALSAPWITRRAAGAR